MKKARRLIAVMAAIITAIALSPPAVAAESAGVGSLSSTLAIIPAVDGTRTLKSDGVNIYANLLPGDTFIIKDGTATLANDKGTDIASVTVNLPAGRKLIYDQTTKTLKMTVVRSAGVMLRRRNCTNDKWVKWIVRVFGNGFVCTPATLAAAGLTGPVAVAFIASGCAGGVEALVTMMSC